MLPSQQPCSLPPLTPNLPCAAHLPHTITAFHCTELPARRAASLCNMLHRPIRPAIWELNALMLARETSRLTDLSCREGEERLERLVGKGPGAGVACRPNIIERRQGKGAARTWLGMVHAL